MKGGIAGVFMAGSKKRRKLKEAEAIEIEPDAWERFEEAVHKLAPPRRPTKKRDQDED